MMKGLTKMALHDNAGNALLAVAGGTGALNWLGTADTAISVVVGILSAVGLVYSIAWHRVRIAEVKRKQQAEREPEVRPLPREVDDERYPDGTYK